MVEQGYMVISFTARRDGLVAAGSQILKTDFPIPATFFPSDYQVGNDSTKTKAYAVRHYKAGGMFSGRASVD